MISFYITGNLYIWKKKPSKSIYSCVCVCMRARACVRRHQGTNDYLGGGITPGFYCFLLTELYIYRNIFIMQEYCFLQFQKIQALF